MRIRLGALRRFLRETLGETDERMVGDGAGDDIAAHLRSNEEGLSLGDPVQEAGALNAEIGRYLLQEDDDQDASAETTGGSSAPAAPTGFYTPFDMEKDHSSTWYRSPGRAAGTSGDPYRSEDPHTQLGFHAPGSDGEAATLAPPIWQLTAGSDTSKVLGANAKPDAGGVGSDGESEEGEEGQGLEGGEPGEEGDEAEGEESSSGDPERGRD